MMARRPHQAQRIFSFTGHNLIDRRHTGPRGGQGHLVGVARDDRIRVKMAAPLVGHFLHVHHHAVIMDLGHGLRMDGLECTLEATLGQAIGLPPTMALFAFIGVVVTAATPLIFNGQVIDDPVVLSGRVGGAAVTFLAMVAISLATLSTNIAANVVSPANDFSNLWPEKISYKQGGYLTAAIGFLMMPWKLLASAGTYLFVWLVGYSAQ